MSSKLPILTFIVVYLLVILIFAPKFMANRKAYALTNTLRLYNILQVLSCLTIVTKFYQAGFTYASALSCESKLESKNYDKLLEIWWFCVFIRVAEFLETVFFILRKKSGQVTFLHVYHHISSLFIVWIPLKHGGSKNLSIFFNQIFDNFRFRCWMANSWNSQCSSTHIDVLLLFSLDIQKHEFNHKILQTFPYIHSNFSTYWISFALYFCYLPALLVFVNTLLDSFPEFIHPHLSVLQILL